MLLNAVATPSGLPICLEFLDGLAPHLFSPGQVTLLVINAGEVGHHHGLGIHVTRSHGTLQRNLTFANCFRRCLDGHCLLAKNSISSGHQNMGSLGAGLVYARAAPALRAFVKSVLISADASIMSIRASSPAGGGKMAKSVQRLQRISRPGARFAPKPVANRNPDDQGRDGTAFDTPAPFLASRPSPAGTVLDQQLFFLRKMLRQVQGLLCFPARFTDIAQVPPGFGECGMRQGIIGIGRNRFDQQVARALKIECPQFGPALRIQPHRFLIRGQGSRAA